MENKFYKYVGITVTAIFVITLVIRLFHLNTQVIEGLTITQLKNERNADNEDNKIVALDNVLDKITKTNEQLDKVIETFKDNKEVTQDVLLEMDEYCDKAILSTTLKIADDNKLESSEEIKTIEKLITLKEAVEQSTKYLLEENTSL